MTHNRRRHNSTPLFCSACQSTSRESHHVEIQLGGRPNVNESAKPLRISVGAAQFRFFEIDIANGDLDLGECKTGLIRAEPAEVSGSGHGHQGLSGKPFTEPTAGASYFEGGRLH